jgi:hypothetical protein
MRGRSLFSLLWFASLSLSLLVCVHEGHALELITAAEAGLPEDPEGMKYGVALGPAIIVLSPSPAAGFIRSPFALRIRFQSHGGASVDADSILLTYKKVPPIDLTQRVRSFITPEHIEIDNVQAPVGQHRIRVDLQDSRGHSGFTEFTIKIRE